MFSSARADPAPARADMGGHTGDMEATTRACALVDSCVKELLAAVDAVGGRWLVRRGCELGLNRRSSSPAAA